MEAFWFQLVSGGLLVARIIGALWKTTIPVYVTNVPLGTTTKDMVQYSQVIPPVYPLEKIRVLVALFKGMGDMFADLEDVQDLSQRFRHWLVMDYVVTDPQFTHLDFVFGYNATDILHHPMMSVLKNYTSIY